MAELTYAELTQGRESTRLPHTHKLTSLKKIVFGPKRPLPGSEMSRYPVRYSHNMRYRVFWRLYLRFYADFYIFTFIEYPHQ